MHYGQYLKQSKQPSTQVILIGISLSSFLIADKLSELGISVILIDKNKK